MRPLFLFCRASGASIKYLYDKTFEMNPKMLFRNGHNGVTISGISKSFC